MPRWLALVLAPALFLDACGTERAEFRPTTATDGGDSVDGTAPATDGGIPDADASEAGDDGGPPPPPPLFAFVGSNAGTIRTYSVAAGGTWTLMGQLDAGTNPTFLAFDPPHRRVVAVDDGATMVRSFSFDASDGHLTLVDSKAAGAKGPVHVSLDPTGRWVFVANYTAGSATSRSLDEDGTLSLAIDTETSGAKSHWAGTNPSGTHVFVPALGNDLIAQYVFDKQTGTLTDNGAVHVPNGSGPRHLAFHPNEQWAYVINELAASVTTFSFDKTTGQLMLVDTISALPPGPNPTGITGAEIVVHPNGKWVYASTRVYSSIVQFEIDQTTGTLTRIANTVTPPGDDQPRSFAIDPDGTLLFAGDQDDDQVVGFRIEADGSLTSLGAPLSIPSPEFVGLARMP